MKYIGELREERLKKYEVNYDSHVAELGRIKDAALKKGAWSAAVNAETNRGKAAGLYIDRKIIKTGKLEDLSEQELENRNETNFRRLLTNYKRYLRDQKDHKVILSIFIIILLGKQLRSENTAASESYEENVHTCFLSFAKT